MNNIKEILLAVFKMKDLGKAKYILSLELQQDRKEGTISLSQTQFIHTVLEHTSMSESKPVWTLLAHNTKLVSQTPDSSGDDLTILEMDTGGKKVSYLIVIRSLMYAMLGTRPNLAFTVGLLGQFSAAPKRIHWETAKRVLRYLKATTNMKLTYQRSPAS
jgi:hypothetical protein